MRQKIVTELRKAFATQLADACRNFTLSRTTTAIDPETDANTMTTQTVSGYGPFLRAKKEDANNDLIAVNDLKILVLADDFDLEPRIGDLINNNLRVSAVGHDPTKALWKIYVRGESWDGIENQ